MQIKTLKELESFLDSKMVNSSESTYNIIQTEVKKIFTKENVRDILISITEDDQLLKQASQFSFPHALGFDRIELVKKENYTLRLHIWWSKNAIEEDIHTHNWEFGSFVLLGSLRSKTYIENNNSNSKYYNYSIQKSTQNKGFDFNYLGLKGLEIYTDSYLKAGSWYYNSNSIIHKVVKNTDDITATFILHGPFESSASKVYYNKPITEKQKDTPIQTFTHDETKDKLNKIINMIQ